MEIVYTNSSCFLDANRLGVSSSKSAYKVSSSMSAHKGNVSCGGIIFVTFGFVHSYEVDLHHLCLMDSIYKFDKIFPGNDDKRPNLRLPPYGW